MNVTIEMMKDNKELRNAVIGAHFRVNKDKTREKIALWWDEKRIDIPVTDELIQQANNILEEDRKETLEKYKNTLLFEGAGWHKAENNGVGNCRIRTEFINDEGKQVYIELTKTSKNTIHISHCIERGLEKQLKGKTYLQPYYNYKGLENDRSLSRLDYTKENILKIVNEKLNCSFEEMYVENFDINCLVFKQTLCYSPKNN